MKYLLFVITIFLTSTLHASENVKVELFKNGASVPLNSYQSTYLYENTIGLLSTCRHLEKVTGNTYSQENGKQTLDKIKSGNYSIITFSHGSPSLPIAHGNQIVDELYTGFNKNGFATIVTVYKGVTQQYTKCSGAITITNFSCDIILSELLSFEMDNERCKIYLNKLNYFN